MTERSETGGIDPITIEVVRHKVEGIANEMEDSLLRSSYSPIVKEGLDASAALFLPDGTTLAQACAIVPGVSRSGGTITAARALGFDRAGAATFSFLMSMPIIAAAAALKAPEALRAPHLAPVVVGMIAAAASGWLAIAGLLAFLRTRGFGVFAAYRLVLGAAVLALVWMRSR